MEGSGVSISFTVQRWISLVPHTASSTVDCTSIRLSLTLTLTLVLTLTLTLTLTTALTYTHLSLTTCSSLKTTAECRLLYIEASWRRCSAETHWDGVKRYVDNATDHLWTIGFSPHHRIRPRSSSWHKRNPTRVIIVICHVCTHLTFTASCKWSISAAKHFDPAMYRPPDRSSICLHC